MNPSDNDRLMIAVEDALRTMPEAPAPAALRSRVMRGVRTLTAAPKFVFPWLEAAISLMLSTLVAGAGSLLLGLPPTTLARLEQTLRYFFLVPSNRPYIAASVIGVGMVVACLFFAVRILLPARRAPLVMRR
jgi:anti-sigma factor RsiW